MRNNTPVPVSRLPSELLSYSFRLNPDFCYTSRLRKAIAITHVCRRWREIACADPALWNHVLFELGEEWFEEMLRRAKNVPLVIHYHAESIPSKSPFQHSIRLDTYLGRVRKLYVSAKTPVMSHVLSVVHSQSAPRLEELNLEHTNPGLGNRGFLRLPSPSFLGNAPRLRILQLTSIGVSWEPIAFNTLEELTINLTLPFFLSERPSVDQLASFLRCLPCLKELFLLCCLPDEVRRGISPNPVQLSQLKHLTIDGSTVSEFSNFLDVVRIPPVCRRYVACHSEYADLSNSLFDPATIASRLYSTLPNARDLDPIDSFSVTVSRYPGELVISYEGWYKTTRPVPLPDGCDDSLFGLRLYLEDDVEIEVIRSVLHALCPPYIRALELYLGYLERDWRWETFAGRYASISRLKLTVMDENIPFLLDALAWRTNRMDQGSGASQGPDVSQGPDTSLRLPSAPSFLPNLSVLSVVIKGSDWSVDQWSDEDWPTMGWTLLSALSYRKECGSAIRKLSIWDWERAEEGLLERLQDVVEQLDFLPLHIVPVHARR
ncbi:hypothetical protein K488DRAFT_91039 [Vararia minispora EC-137]|uniref:Uncharacterized protein n=1 Tax=Vararia minispora EC-137 TaxID=1314806 RepID=A0ACB8Q6X0_9AGAM|nr:hypothetical protein K488DRAFT_91039 [Vararia minispora EC-137]